MKYKLSMFKFDLPQTRIADKPTENREDSKLMVIHRSTGEIEHKTVADLGAALNSGAHLSKLCRTSIGDYQLVDALDVSDFEKQLNS